MPTNSRDIVRRLEREGWRLARVKGSHHQFKHIESGRRATAAHPRKDMPPKTVASIYRDVVIP